MKSPLEQIQSLEEIIRQLSKIDSKLIAGQIVLAHRENWKLITNFRKQKFAIIQEEKLKKQEDKTITLEMMQDIEETEHILLRIDGFLWAGQILQAYGLNNKLVSSLKKKLFELNKETK